MIVLVSGWLGSGKDTVSHLLCRYHNFKKYAFADVLKDEVAKVFCIPRDWMDSDEGKKKTWRGRTVRHYLIDYGQACREENINCWVDPVCDKISRGNVSHVVISDWRMPSEFERITQTFPDRKVITLRVVRYDEPPLKDYTETALDTFKFDYIIDNKGSVADLETSIQNLCLD